MKDKGLKVVIEELKHRIAATSAKLIRYDEAKTEQYVQNRMLHTNHEKLFERLEKENRSNDRRPGSQKCEILEWDIRATRVVWHTNTPQ